MKNEKSFKSTNLNHPIKKSSKHKRRRKDGQKGSKWGEIENIQRKFESK